MSKVIVVGGGAAGMMACHAASLCGHQVTLLEKNEKLGKKIYITGKGRCNLTNASDMEVIFANVMSNKNFCTVHFIPLTIIRLLICLRLMEWLQKQNAVTGFFQYRIIPQM